MGAFGVTLGILHYLGLYIQLSVSSRQGGHPQWDNQISANAVFTEAPHDMTTRAGEDVEMACSYRGSSPLPYSLEIQWWYVRSHKEWTGKKAWASNQLKASQQEDAEKDATKISVVKVVGSNISHKLRLSRVKMSDEGTYECRVIDFSDGKARHHKVKAYLRVEPDKSELYLHGVSTSSSSQLQDTQLSGSNTNDLPPDQAKLSGTHQQAQSPHHHHQKGGKELKKRSADASCPDSCAL